MTFSKLEGAFYVVGEYQQNLCASYNSSCLPCSDRLPSCVGLANGKNSFSGRVWSPYYVDCLNNRTYTVHRCTNGWFHPVQRLCVTQIHPGMFSKIFKLTKYQEILCFWILIYVICFHFIGDVISFCSANKNAISADSLNAAHFINCSDHNPNISHYIQECPYPQLFSTETHSCQDFRTVPVDSRIVPQAPCKF